MLMFVTRKATEFAVRPAVRQSVSASFVFKISFSPRSRRTVA